MDTPRILQIDPQQPDQAALREAADVLASGGLVILPTETVYGLAARPEVPGAMERLCAAKGRATAKPVALFARDLLQVERRGAKLGKAGRILAERFWPGPMTLVVPTPKGREGFRIPDHPVPLRLLEICGDVVAVTSANRSGEGDARTADEAVAQLGRWVGLVLDAGPAGMALPSTVVEVGLEGVSVLRRGTIPEDAIRQALSDAGLEI